MLKFNFEKARTSLFKNGYTQKQVDSINALVEKSNLYNITNKAQLAYILATAYHECYNPKTPETRLTPMTEFGGDKYLRSKKYYPYYGRGFVQLTWLENYQKETKRLGIDLVNNPNLVLDIKIAADIAVYGMINGRFTSKKLDNYINSKGIDFINARRIINGTDKAAVIADYATNFMKCIELV